MSGDREPVEIFGTIVGTREKAIWLFDGLKREWLPRSQIELAPVDAGEGENVTVTMPQWLAKEKGLI